MQTLVEAYRLKGQIAISLNDYEGAIEAFDNALYLTNIPNPSLLLWSGYAHFLVAEYKLTSKKKKSEQKEKIVLSIFKLETARKLLKERQLTLMQKGRGMSIMEESELEGIYEDLTYVLYFLGYLYFKADDYFLAKDTLIECCNIKITNPTDYVKKIKIEAENFLTCLWEQYINPIFWRWWWYSPIRQDEKRFLFAVISVLIIWAFLNLKLYCPLFHIISIDSITIQIIFILALIGILLFPTIHKFKAKEYEVELKSAPPLNFLPGKFRPVSTKSDNNSPPKDFDNTKDFKIPNALK